MSLKRYAVKRDQNEQQIIDALCGVGADVVPLSQEGIGDLLVGWRGENYMLEVKTDKGGLTDAQKRFAATWRGHYAVVRNVEEALAVLGVDA
jgi:hypothetical protein